MVLSYMVFSHVLASQHACKHKHVISVLQGLPASSLQVGPVLLPAAYDVTASVLPEAANTSGQIRHSNQVVACKVRILHYFEVAAKIQELHQQGRPFKWHKFVGILREFDHYVRIMPGSVPRPGFMRSNSESDDDVDIIEENPYEVMYAEEYVVQCLLDKVVKSESRSSASMVKQEGKLE